MLAFIGIVLILLGAVLLALGTASSGGLAKVNDFLGTLGLIASLIITIIVKLF